MKILFITIHKLDGNFGGAKATYRNYMALQSFAEVEVYLIQKRSSAKSILSIVEGNFPPILNEDKKNITNKLKNKKYDAVFIDSSVLGNIAEEVRKISDIPIILFFHNCEHDYIDVRFAGHKGLKSKVYQRLIDKAEKKAVDSSDVRIVFTKRDKNRIEELYWVEVQNVIPIGMSDSYKDVEYECKEEPYCLLFGPCEAANEEAFGWFVENVSPRLNCKTKIAGKNMDSKKEAWSSDKVIVQGFVEDLGQMYADAKCVAIPLMSGGGMKIKTSEALMYGKYIFGTDEAFVGYDIDIDSVGGLCNTADEYVTKINGMVSGESNYNEISRKIYIDNYSIESGIKAFGAIRDYIEGKVNGQGKSSSDNSNI